MESNLYSLSHCQKRLLYFDRLYPDSNYLNICFTFKFEGKKNYLLFNKAVNILLIKNDSLRLRMKDVEDEIKQFVSSYKEYQLDFIDFGEGQVTSTLNNWMDNQVRAPFKNIIDNDLFYFALLKDVSGNYIFFVKMHHLLSDGWTIKILSDQIIEYYKMLEKNIEIPLDNTPSYLQYVSDEEKYLLSDKFKENRRFWNDKMMDYSEFVSLKPKISNMECIEAERNEICFSSEMSSKIYDFCRQYNTSIYRLFLSIIYIYIYKVTSKSDVIIGTFLHNRFNKEYKNILGPFVNTVPFCIQGKENLDYLTLVNTIGEDLKEIISNQPYPYDVLIQELRKDGSKIEKYELYDVLFAYQNTKFDKEIDNVEWKFNGTDTNPLTINVSDRSNKGEIKLEIDYQSCIFSKEEIQKMSEHLINILNYVLENPYAQIKKIELLSNEEKSQLLFEFNNTESTFSNHKTIHEIFEEQVSKYPERVALSFKDQVLTYKSFNEKSNQLARILRKQGVNSDSIVGIMVDRSFEMLIGIMAILKSGGAYLPIDPQYPEERVLYTVKDSGASVLLTQSHLISKINFQGTVLNLDDNNIYTGDVSNPCYKVNPNNLAYVIYTSGSTGNPKGVMIEHLSAVNILTDLQRRYSLLENDSYLLKTSYTFDVSVSELFGWFWNGGRLVISEKDTEKEPNSILNVIDKHNITHINFVPSMLGAFISFLNEDDIKIINKLKYVFVAGEAISKEVVKKFYSITKEVVLENIYGPTESTIYALGYSLADFKNEGNVPIGKPFANTTAYIVDKFDNLMPIGAPGELCLGGIGLARGYLNRPELTKEKFVTNPYMKGELMYRTGDLARWLPDGNIDFMGRIDFQVKIRGFRIELGEIENKLMLFNNINEAVVLARKDSHGNDFLCGYFVSDNKLNIYDIKEHLQKTLPEYMVPAFFIQLDKMPLTQSGKTDRRALPEPTINSYNEKEYVAPRDQVEIKLALIWEDVLNIEKIGVNDSFYNLGGHSILMMQIIARISNEFKINIRFNDFIKLKTIAKLSKFISENKTQTGREIYPKKTADFKNLYNSFPLTDVQMAYLMGRGEQFELGGISTHLYIEFDTELNIEKINIGLKKAIERHPMLRAVISADGYQTILKEVPEYEIAAEDLSELSFVDQEKRIFGQRERMSHYIFNTEIWPLFEFKVYKLSENNSRLFVSFDMLICDGSSLQQIMNEVVEYHNNTQIIFPKLEFTFRDYILAYEEYKESDVYAHDKEYWMEKVEDFPQAPMLPLKESLDNVKKPHFNRLSKNVGKETWELIKRKAQKHNVTPAAFFATAYAQVLSYWANQQNLAINSTVFNRYPFHKDVNKIVGDFTSVILLGIELQRGESLWDRAKHVQETFMEALDHRHFDGVEFIRELSKQRNIEPGKAAMPVVFTSIFKGDKNDKKDGIFDLGNVKMMISQTSQVYLDHQILETNNGLSLAWDYVEDVFEQSKIEEMFLNYINIIENEAVSDDEFKLTLSESEKSLYESYNSTNEDIPEITLHRLFVEQAGANPEKKAVIFGDEYITYSELNKKSNQMAAYLKEKGVTKGDFIGILANRCIESIINIMGILKAGAAYVPIDPEYPIERKNYILENSGCKMMLIPSLYKKEGLSEYPTTFEADLSNKDDVAYVIYTSGSTGMPKGVVISHKAACNTIIDINRKFNVNPEDRIIGLSSMCFDLSVYDIFGALSAGAVLVIISDQRDVTTISEAIKKYGVTIWNSVPAIMEMLVDNLDDSRENEELSYWNTERSKEIAILGGGFDSLRLVLLSGDWIGLKLPTKINVHFENAQIISLGGATEASIWSIYYPIEEIERDWNSIPYGRPLANQYFYVLNYELEICPIGVPGELYIGGLGLANGYLNDAEKTKNSFINHPSLGYIYKTGDHGVMNKDGYIEFLGRKDHQIKIRGYRVELGEIESRLLEHEKIKSAVVIDIQDENKRTFLCSYFVADSTIDVTSLRDFLRERLPEYMIPSYFIEMNEIPLTINGKIDRKSLTVPDIGGNDNFVAPRNELEKEICEIWSYVLGIDKIGIYDSFFELGGNSILMVQIRTRISKILKIDVSMREIMEKNTISKLGEFIKNNKIKTESIVYIDKHADLENINIPFPLTEIQMAYLIGRGSQFEIGGVSTHAYVELETKLDIERLNISLQKVITKHPMLRAIILPGGEQQILKEVPEYKIDNTDLRSLNQEKQMEYILTERARMSHWVFQTDKWPLFEMKAFKISNKLSYLFFSFDMLIGDGASVEIFTKELMDFYNNPLMEVNPIEFSFRDYILAYKEFRDSKVYMDDKEYWLKKLDEIPQAPALPLRERPENVKEPHFKRHSTVIEKNEWEKIKKKAQKHKITPSTLLCTAYVEVLKFWSNQQRLTVNLTAFNRYPFHEDVNKVIGDFTSVVLLGLDLQLNSSFWEKAKYIQDNLMEALEHRHYEGVELIREIAKYYNYPPSKAIMPVVFTSMLFSDKKDNRDGLHEIGDIKMIISQTSQVFLDYQVVELYGGISIVWDYVDELFDPEVIDTMFKQYLGMLTHMAKSDEEYILTLNEKEKCLLEEYNNTKEDIEETTLHKLFLEMVKEKPDNIAVIFGDNNLSYQELHEKSNQVALFLKENGVRNGDYVGVLTKRCIESIVNMLGILKVGAAYVPIDANYPEERKSYILDNSNCKLLLSPDIYKNEHLNSLEAEFDAELNNEDAAAYVIYTSGSTGNPKGVVITHKAACNTIININRKFNVTEVDRIIGLSSMCFDLSVYDIFGALSTGAALVIVEDQRDVTNLIDIIDKYSITIWNSVPAIMDMLIETYAKTEGEDDVSYWSEGAREALATVDFVNLDSLRLVLLSGDWIPLKLTEKIRCHFENAEIISLGGATEASIWSIYHHIEDIKGEWSSIPYGKPLANQNLYVLNYELEQCPLDVPGELYIGGVGIAKEYLNDNEKTQKSFIKHPIFGNIYKTGDYGVMRKEEFIEFLGRKDHQVKIRGYRVELGEIESKLLKYKEIKNAVVVDLKDDKNRIFLCAYIVSEERISIAELRDYLLMELPEYMIPTSFMYVKEIPLTSNGKVDRKNLPQPEINEEIIEEYEAPRNQIEEELSTIWGEVLGIKGIGINGNFFEIGGNSVMLIKTYTLIRDKYAKKLKVTDLFANPTISKLAEFIKKLNRNQYTNLSQLIVPLRLPDDYFVKGVLVDEEHSYSFKINEKISSKLKKIALNEKVEVSDIFISIKANLLSQLSGKNSLTLQVATNERENVIPIDINMSGIEGLREIFGIVNHKRIRNEGYYNIDDIRKIRILEHKNSIVSLFYKKGVLSSNYNLLSIYDIIFELSELGSGYEITCEYNSKCLVGDKIKGFMQLYVKMLEIVSEKY